VRRIVVPAAVGHENQALVEQDVERLLNAVLVFGETGPIAPEVHAVEQPWCSQGGYVEDGNVERSSVLCEVVAEGVDTISARLHMVNKPWDLQLPHLLRRSGVRQIEGEKRVSLLDGYCVGARSIEANGLQILGAR